ncbi:biliverdin-producing heme oxygenase [Paracoccus suum]|uniref:biliverdin-producing heme oxygenase n=1 Tax=Paracoccus suum TaxID=2259340 RepID=UPI0013B04BCD|nr:biliverdin-producing heme oxygenase [Paracoccus suum]
MDGSDQLRGRLRAETRPHHQRVDDAFAALDLGRAGDLTRFLAAQLSALEALVPQDGPDCAEAEALAATTRAAIAADLRTLGAGPRARLAPQQADATAVLYVLLGSRLGAQVLARRWLATADALARGAGQYLTMDSQSARWRALCARLAALPAAGAAGDALVAQVGAIFDLYTAALERTPSAAQDRAYA